MTAKRGKKPIGIGQRTDKEIRTMNKDEKFVKSIYPDAECNIFFAPDGHAYQILFGGHVTWWFPSKKQAWHQVSTRISEKILRKLSQ